MLSGKNRKKGDIHFGLVTQDCLSWATQAFGLGVAALQAADCFVMIETQGGAALALG